MAFFCPGSGAKIKKEFDNHNKRHHDYQGMHSPSQPNRHQSAGYQSPNNVPTKHHSNTMERVHDNVPHTTIVSTQFFQKMIVLHDHYPNREMELAVRKGEKVEVVKKEPEWLFVRNERGREGYVPARNCFAPVTRRTRSNSRSYAPIRPVASGEVIDNGSRHRGGVPMYSSSSAGIVRRYESPMGVNDSEQDMFQRVNSPSSAILSPYEPSDTHLDKSVSSSSGVSLMDTNSPALTRAFSQDELKPYNVDNSMISLSQSVIDSTTTRIDKTFLSHKHSSSDDSGTADSTHLRDYDYASTIRNGDTSSEEGIIIERVSSRGITPSIRDRPLPSPPKRNSDKEETPPPPPPRNASLDPVRHRSGTAPIPVVIDDDLSPYAQPVDLIEKQQYNNRIHALIQKQQQQQQHGSRSVVDVSDTSSGIDSPYSEVYRPQQQQFRRPINVHDSRDSPLSNRRHGGKTQRSMGSLARTKSPLINGSDHDMNKQTKGGILKFRKYLWGAFICMKDFEGIDENEVSVAAGEHVMVFNQDDQFWFWIVKHKTDQSEGFVPASILREVDDTGNQEPIQIKHRTVSSPPRRSNRQTTPLPPLPTSSSSHRARGKSVSSALSTQLTTADSIEKLPFDVETPLKTILAPSSPPPPYAEQDPNTYSSQPSSHDSQMPPLNHPIPRTSSHSIVRNRPPSYPRTRSSTSQMHPSSPLMYQGHISQSANRLNHAHQNNYPSSTVTTGGTLV